MEMKLLSPDQAAEALKLETGTLANWRSQGTGPAYVRVGRKIFYNADDLAAYVHRRRVDPEAQASAA